MQIDVPVEKTFDCPEGVFRAVLIEAREHTKVTKAGPQKLARLVFEVKLPRQDGKTVVVGKSFPPSLNPDSELRLALESWLGDDICAASRGQKFDLANLVGKEADIQTHHFQKSDYTKPFVNLVGVYPPGTFTTTNQP
jgi:hypothetical protein